MEAELANFWVMILAAVLGFCVFVFGFLRRFNDLWTMVKLGKKVYKTLPPGDMGWPLIGSSLWFYKAFSASGDPDSFIKHLRSRYGRVGMYKTHLFGKPAVIVTDPEICRRVYSDDKHFVMSYPKSVKILGTGSLSRIDHRITHRFMAAPINGSEALARYVGFIEQVVVRGLEEWSSMRKPIELLHEIKRLTFRIIIHVFMGSALDPHIPKLEKLYAELSAAVFVAFAIDVPGSTYHRALKAKEEIQNILRPVIEEKRRIIEKNEEMEDKCQLDAVIKGKNGKGEKIFDNDAIIDMLLGLLYAGHHTSAHGTMWALIQLLEHPQVYEKAKEEQELIMKQRPSTQKGLIFNEIKQMTYLVKVINEMLRRVSIVFANFREAATDVNINGYTIPKGWVVPVWIKGVHMDPQIYPNPEEFNPSRWDTHTPKPGAFIPFGFGNRFCPGNELAKLEITILLHHFLLKYRWERVNPKASITSVPMPSPIDQCLAKITAIPSS